MKTKLYVVMYQDKAYVFKLRTVLCNIMSEMTGMRWKKESLDYHFMVKKKNEANYKGCRILLCDYYKGTIKKSK